MMTGLMMPQAQNFAGKAQEAQCTAAESETSTSSTQAAAAETSATQAAATQVSSLNTVSANFSLMCNAMAADADADLHISGLEPSDQDPNPASGDAADSKKKGAGPEGSESKEDEQSLMDIRHDPKLDKAMETWAQAQLGIIKVRGG
jgi:hypothetical protein